MKIINNFIEKISNRIADRVIDRWRREAMQEMAWEVFSVLGLDELDKVIAEHKKENKTGHSDYGTLAHRYAERLRTLALERVEKLKEILDEL